MFRMSFLRGRELIAAFYCPVCKTGFDDRVTLAIHIRKKH
jgi:hypothetical protein